MSIRTTASKSPARLAQLSCPTLLAGPQAPLEASHRGWPGWGDGRVQGRADERALNRMLRAKKSLHGGECNTCPPFDVAVPIRLR